MRSHRSKWKSDGFSLPELLGVLVVIGILLLIAGPSLREQANEHRANQVAMDVYADFMYAKSEAMKRQDDVVIVFSPSNKSYDIVYDVGSDWTPGHVLGSEDVYLKEDVTLPGDYTFAGSSYGIYGVDNEGLGLGVTFRSSVVYFQPSGRISDAHDDTLQTLVKRNNRAVYVTRYEDSPQNIYSQIRAIVADGISGQCRIWRYRGTWITHD
jgi:prepilin-type N-terminal cleavage/methylation domain-containing protein